MGSAAEGSTMAINPHISDLFFNSDVSETKMADINGQFMGYNEDELARVATDFLTSLSALGVNAPTLDELLEDFHSRQ